MNILSVLWAIVKMFYQLFWCSAKLLTLVFNIFWFASNLASACIPWLTLVLMGVCVISKFAKLRSPDEKRLLSLLGGCMPPEDLTYWPIANRGAGYDAPENSKTALKKCSARGYRNVLMEANLTACGEIVIINRDTLERAGFSGNVTRYTLKDLQKINITELHPLGSQFEADTVLTLADLMQLLNEYRLSLFLHLLDNSAPMLEKLKTFMRNNAQFSARTILVSRSPYAIYQLRKSCPELICGLWTEKSFSLPTFKASTLITSIFGAILRNIIAPVIGISVVFVSKEEFNLHVAELWRNVGVRPFVYNVNSPNEKRYFQKTMKTQYLTDSLRSEPHLLMKA